MRFTPRAAHGSQAAGRISELHALRRPARRRRDQRVLPAARERGAGGHRRSVRDFPGRRDIGIGEHWSGKLDRMLDEARFFIPILTPSYFTSEACRDELDKFLQRRGTSGAATISSCRSTTSRATCSRMTTSAQADPSGENAARAPAAGLAGASVQVVRTAKVRRALEQLAREIAKRPRRRPMRTAHESRRTRPSAAGACRAPRTTSNRGGTDGRSHESADAAAPHGRQSKPGTVFRDIDAPWCPELVVIPPGEFMMGSTEAEREWAIEQGAEREWVERESRSTWSGLPIRWLSAGIP